MPKYTREGSRLTVHADGRIDTNNAQIYMESLGKGLEGIDELIIDCADLDYISSSGLRVVMAAVKIMQKQGTIRIINVPAASYEILEATGFTGICPVEKKPDS